MAAIYIPSDVVRRRYDSSAPLTVKRGRNNLTQLYLPLCDTWIIYDNTGDEPNLVAASGLDQPPIIYDPYTFGQITASTDE